jgi:hypothetical protein
VGTAQHQKSASIDTKLTTMNRTAEPSEPAAASPGEARPELWISWMTCGMDGQEHAVTDEQAVAGLKLGRGVYDAVCGWTISPLAMTGPPGRRCAHCCIFVRARFAAPRTTSWWRRLRRRLRRSA